MQPIGICPNCGEVMQNISGEGARLQTWFCNRGCQQAEAETKKAEDAQS